MVSVSNVIQKVKCYTQIPNYDALTRLRLELICLSHFKQIKNLFVLKTPTLGISTTKSFNSFKIFITLLYLSWHHKYLNITQYFHSYLTQK